jgi:hypothetical protein
MKQYEKQIKSEDNRQQHNLKDIIIEKEEEPSPIPPTTNISQDQWPFNKSKSFEYSDIQKGSIKVPANLEISTLKLQGIQSEAMLLGV